MNQLIQSHSIAKRIDIKEIVKILRVTCCLFLLLLALVALMVSITAPRAYAAGSGSASQFRFQGKSAMAFFDSVSSDGCVDTSVFVDGTQSGKGQEADVSIFQFNNCTGTELLSASGSTSTPNFQVSSSLFSATLSATISVFDSVSGNTFPVSVSVTWSAAGPLLREIESAHTQMGSSEIVNTNLDQTVRFGSASGTVSNGTTNFTPSPAFFDIEIASVNSGEVDIIHP